MAPVELEETLFKYAENFFEAAHMITEFILYAEHPDIGKLDMYFFPITFLYRHCIELGLKAIGFQYIEDLPVSCLSPDINVNMYQNMDFLVVRIWEKC